MQLAFSSPLDDEATYEVRMKNGLHDYEDLEIIPFPSYYFTTLPLITTTMISPTTTEDVATGAV